MTAKPERIQVRLSREHKALIEDAALLRRQSLAGFVVSEALKAARRLQLTVLTRRDWEQFLEIADREEEPLPTLTAAARKHPRSV